MLYCTLEFQGGISKKEAELRGTLQRKIDSLYQEADEATGWKATVLILWRVTGFKA